MSEQDQAIVAATRLLDAAADAGWRGSDPYDGLWWSWPRALRGGPRRRQALMQMHARAPFDFRGLYRRERSLIPKALGVFGSVGVRLNQLTGAEGPLRSATAALDALVSDHSAGAAAWGYPWDTQTRWSFYPANSPNIVATSFAVAGLADGAHGLDRAAYLERARAAAEWIHDDLFVADGNFFAYHRDSRTLIHNANLLGARAVHELLGDAGRERVVAAVDRTLAAQAADGSWPYGQGPNLHFVDSFHTGYNLECLCALREVDPRVDRAVRRGAEYYLTRFFGSDGSASLWPNKPYPKDGHSAGTGLTTVARLVELGYAPEETLRLLTSHVVDHVVVGAHAVHRRWRMGRSTVSYIRWCDAHVALGLANAARVLRLTSRDAQARTERS